MLLAVLLLGQSAATLRARADTLLSGGKYDEASAAFSRAADAYAKLGDPNSAKVLRGYADRYRTEIGLFGEEDAPALTAGLAKWEPAAGCYLGAFLDREDSVPKFVADGRRHGDPAAFGEATGKGLALAFTYVRLGTRFPLGWGRRLRAMNVAPMLAVEPTSVAQGSDERLLRDFGRGCREVGGPVFVRYASEMNGAWTPYHGDPAGYVRMFRTAARIIRDEAPNTAMVWCPNEVPEEEIPRYYPGADAVDWAAVNFYSVAYNDGRQDRDARWRNPLDALRFVYGRYSAAHPIMVGEWAATHRSVVDRVERPEFAREKIGQFYATLPKRFPRVKAVSWLSMDTERYAMPGRQLNDFSLLDSGAVLAKYRDETAAPWYLSRVGESAPSVWRTLGATARERQRLSVDARTYVGSPVVEVRVNGTLVRRIEEPGLIAFPLPAPVKGGWTVEVRLFDAAKRIAGRRSWRLRAAS